MSAENSRRSVILGNGTGSEEPWTALASSLFIGEDLENTGEAERTVLAKAWNGLHRKGVERSTVRVKMNSAQDLEISPEIIS